MLSQTMTHTLLKGSCIVDLLLLKILLDWPVMQRFLNLIFRHAYQVKHAQACFATWVSTSSWHVETSNINKYVDIPHVFTLWATEESEC